MANGQEKASVTMGMGVFISAIVGAFTLGGSTVGAMQAYFNSQTAVAVKVQHGREIQGLRDRISQMQVDIVTKTAERWTLSDHSRYASGQAEINNARDRRIEALERLIDQHREGHP